MSSDHEMRDECKVLFGGVKDSLADIKAKQKVDAEAAEDRHAQVMQVFNGNPGDKNKPGLVGRLDRLEEKDINRDRRDANHKWWLRAMVGTILGVIAKLVHGWQVK